MDQEQEPSYTDDAKLGLVREVLQIILGLEPEVEERVLNLLKGSVDAQDVKTPEMRQRIGNRAMKYLTNAIDLARSEGAEVHDDDVDYDLEKSRRGDMEPGHKRRQKPVDPEMEAPEEDSMREGITFKSYLLNELNFDVNLDDKQATNDAIMKIKRGANQGSARMSRQNVKDAKNNMDMARDQDPGNPTKSLDVKIASLSAQLAQLQQRRAQIAGRSGEA